MHDSAHQIRVDTHIEQHVVAKAMLQIDFKQLILRTTLLLPGTRQRKTMRFTSIDMSYEAISLEDLSNSSVDWQVFPVTRLHGQGVLDLLGKSS